MIIDLPYKFESRPYQIDVMKAFFVDGYRRFINIWHRRAGKDRTWFNILIGAALKKQGLYIHAFPTLSQARRAIWEGMMPDGTKFLDHIPPSLISGTINNSEMKISLINGSIIRLAGTDYYNSWVGTNPLGVVFSEYSVQNPLAWDLIRPILTENDGWAAFIYTPRSRNHAYDLYNRNKNNDKWFVSYLTIEDTKDNQGNSIVKEQNVEDLRSFVNLVIEGLDGIVSDE